MRKWKAETTEEKKFQPLHKTSNHQKEKTKIVVGRIADLVKNYNSVATTLLLYAWNCLYYVHRIQVCSSVSF